MGILATHNTIATKKELQPIHEQMRIAFSEVQKKSMRGNFVSAAMAFSDIQKNIREIKRIIGPLSLLTTPEGDSPVRDILLLAEQSGKMGEIAAQQARLFLRIPDMLLSQQSVLPVLKQAEKLEKGILALTQRMERSLQKVSRSPVLSAMWRDKAKNITGTLHEIEEQGEKGQYLFSAAYALLRGTTAIFYQNTGEIRATGGFMGSMSYLFGKNGVLTGEFHDIYELSWKDTSHLPPPPGFERLAKKMNVQDANFEPNFPDSANAIRKMLAHTSSPVPETVVVVNDALFFEILKKTGGIPIFVQEKKILLTANNAPMLLSFLVEAKASGLHTPKNILRDAIPVLFQKGKQLSISDMADIVRKAIEKKWILAHSTNADIQRAIEMLGIDGKIRSGTEADFLAVFSANVGGNKSDRFLRETLHITSIVSAEQVIINTLNITHKHTWGEKENMRFEKIFATYGGFALGKNILREIMGAGENHSFVQVVVPKGSTLLAVSGVPAEAVRTENKNGKTVFSFRFPAVAAGKEESVQLQYRLPKREQNDNFDLVFQSQPGRGAVRVIREILRETGVSMEGKAFSVRETETDTRFFAKIL